MFYIKSRLNSGYQVQTGTLCLALYTPLSTTVHSPAVARTSSINLSLQPQRILNLLERMSNLFLLFPEFRFSCRSVLPMACGLNLLIPGMIPSVPRFAIRHESSGPRIKMHGKALPRSYPPHSLFYSAFLSQTS